MVKISHSLVGVGGQLRLGPNIRKAKFSLLLSLSYRFPSRKRWLLTAGLTERYPGVAWPKSRIEPAICSINDRLSTSGWSGGAMVLGKLPVPWRPTIWMIVGQGPIALAVGAGGVVWTFILSSVLSLLFLPLSGRRPDID